MEFLKEFGIQPTLLIAQIVNFLIILFLLKRFFYKPIIKLLDDRKKNIEESLKNTELIEERLQQTEEKSTQIIEEARRNSQNLISKSKKEAYRILAQAAIEARKSAEQTILDAQTQLNLQKQEMKKEIERETLTLVVEVVRKVLGRTVSPKEKQVLTSRAASEIGRKIQ